jgi:hypothetical protein
MKYRSTGQSGFEAIQVNLDYSKPHHWKREKPIWFQERMDTGDLMPVRDKDHRYVMVRNKHGHMRAYEGEWIIRNKDGLVFVMPDNLFKESFRLEE